MARARGTKPGKTPGHNRGSNPGNGNPGKPANSASPANPGGSTGGARKRGGASPVERGLSPVKRAAILKAAADAFRREGFHAATMDAIAEEADVSKRTVYNHFPSKDVLFDVVTEDLWGRLAGDGQGDRGRTRSVEARLAEMARQKLDALIDPQVVGLLRAVSGDQARSPELLRAYGGGRGQLGLSRMLEEEVAAGRLAIEQVDLAAAQFWGLTLGSLFWPLVIGFRTAPDETERELVIEEAVVTFVARYGVRAQKPRGRRRID